ncbi:MAG TPA: response regulator [Paracoccaceae bacterium]|nr:response regulator [Paracoccaceae bacterium]
MPIDGPIDELRGRRILIVEDESLILLTIEDIIEELGCEVAGTAMRAEAAIAIVASRPVDAALLDVNLGVGQTSYPVAEALAARGIPFAFLTGYGSGAVRPEYQDRPVLSKPVDQHALEAALRGMMPAARLEEG